ncbi:MAG: hypothetical protein ACC657_12850, partial [Thiohalomonadales bacterium]
MSIQSILFNIAKFFLKVNGELLTVITLTGTESLSGVFQFKIEALIDRFFDISTSIKSTAQLTLIGIDGYER